MTPLPYRLLKKKQDQLTTFMFALKATETRRQWPKRLKMFFNFLTLQGSLADQSKEFVPKARQNINGPNMSSNAL